MASGQSTARVQAGELHREVGGYPSTNHRMPVCCAVMKRRMGEADAVLISPPKGAGANLTIEYRLPRLSTERLDSAREDLGQGRIGNC